MFRRHGSRSTWRGPVVAVLAVLLAVAAGTGATGTVEADPTAPTFSPVTGAASRYVPINPVRLLDSRADADIDRLISNQAITVAPLEHDDVMSRAGVAPADVQAVVVNTTIVRADGPGYATIWPTGSPQPFTSTNNASFTGQNIANLAIVPVGIDGRVSVYASGGTDVIVDVLGVFAAAPSSRSGRLVVLPEPVRHSDTRVSATRYRAGETRVVDLSGVIPADASAVVANVTVANTGPAGFLRVWGDGDPVPAHSNVNWPQPRFAAANQVITKVGDGRIRVFASSDTELVIDVTGYFTSASAADGTAGLFVATQPGRLLDSRETSGPTALTGGERLVPGEVYRIGVPGRLEFPSTGVAAAAFNFTAVQTIERGHMSAVAAGAPLPGPNTPSTLNFVLPGSTVPNHAITAVGPQGVDVVVSTSIHLVADATGWFLDDTVAPPPGVARQKVVAPADLDPARPTMPTPDGPYDFLFDREFDDGSRNAWDRCAPLDYQVNVDIADQDAIDALLAGVEEIEVATGIDFVYRGVTSGGTNLDVERFAPRGVEAIIGFSDRVRTPELGGGTIGIGGAARSGSTPTAPLELGFALIDLQDLFTLGEVRATATHEIGHMVGLGHITESDQGRYLPGTWTVGEIRDQLMYPLLVSTLSAGEPAFDHGDRLGLWDLYGTQECGTALVRSALSDSSVELSPDTGGPHPADAGPLDWTIIVDTPTGGHEH